MAPTLFEYQLELVKFELETINSSIRQMDEITKSIKHWTIGLWTGALGFCLATSELQAFTAATATIPLLFWFIEGTYRKIQRRFIWRSETIGKFLRGEDLKNSFLNSEIRGLTIWDPASVYKQTPKYKKFISIKKVMWFPSAWFLYGGLIVLSVAFGIIRNIIK